MENTPPDSGLSLTLAWGPGVARRRSLPLGALFRVTFGLALCAACYEAGRWHGGLEAQADRTPLRPLASVQALKTAPLSDFVSGIPAPGNAVGAPEKDVITPLNVRDPSALVMGPGAMTQPPPAIEPAEPPPSPPARIFPRPNLKVKPSRHF